LASGESFAYAAESVWRRVEARRKKSLIAVGVNCLSPDFVSKLFKSVRMEIPLVVYPNSGKKKHEASLS
jgi:homocysteine S-methyltransferase